MAMSESHLDKVLKEMTNLLKAGDGANISALHAWHKTLLEEKGSPELRSKSPEAGTKDWGKIRDLVEDTLDYLMELPRHLAENYSPREYGDATKRVGELRRILFDIGPAEGLHKAPSREEEDFFTQAIRICLRKLREWRDKDSGTRDVLPELVEELRTLANKVETTYRGRLDDEELLRRLKEAPTSKAFEEALRGSSPGDWPEDFIRENGNYINQCCVCLRLFKGHKRRVICSKCAVGVVKNYAREDRDGCK